MRNCRKRLLSTTISIGDPFFTLLTIKTYSEKMCKKFYFDSATHKKRLFYFPKHVLL